MNPFRLLWPLLLLTLLCISTLEFAGLLILQNFRSSDIPKGNLIRLYWTFVWVWIAIGVVYCAIISVLVCYQLWPVWSHMHTSNLPDPDDTRASISISQRWSRPWTKHRRGRAVVPPPPPPLSHHHHHASGKINDNTSSTVTEGVATTTVVTPPSIQLTNSLVTGNHGVTTYTTDKHRRKVRFAIQRIMMYPLVPIITQSLSIAFVMAENTSL